MTQGMALSEIDALIAKAQKRQERPSRAAGSPLERALGVQPEELDRHKTSWTVDELLTANFPEPRWVVPGLLPVGLASLAGRPKLGKSWLALQLAVGIATGGRCLDVQIERAPVLYLALEDSPRRVKSRLEMLQVPHGVGIQFETAWLPLDGDGDAGLTDLQRRIAAMQPGLVVIDTLARSFSSRVDWNDIGQTTATLAVLQSLALDHDLCILCVDHHRKTNGMLADVIDDVLGSTGKSAVVDTAWGLYRKRGERGATLRVTGRDLEERELALEFDALTCCWQLLGDARQVAAGEAEQGILQALQEMKEGDAGQLAKYLDKSRQAVARVLNRMETQGKLRSRLQGKCRLFCAAVADGGSREEVQ